MTQVLKKTGMGTTWISQDALAAAPIPPSLAKLIVQTGSLTECLRKASTASFSVRLLRQEKCTAGDLPEHLLATGTGSGLLREVYLVSDGRPAVFAQTFVPYETLQQHPWLAELGNEPLGQRLFARRDLQRMPFDFACLGPEDRLLRDALQGLDTAPGTLADIWARRSLFLLSGLPVSINEVFFPATFPSAVR